MRRFQKDEIEEMAEVLKQDGVISVPTDTVFGVCARMDTLAAQEQLRKVKNRPLDKTFPIMCANFSQVEEIVEVDPTARKVMKAFLPGPLTIVLKKKKEVPEYVSGGLDTLAIRLATSNELEQVIQAVGVPVFMTSANQSGQPVCTSLEEIEQACPLLDGMMEGQPSFGQASTIISILDGKIKVLREGPISLEEIQEVLR